MRIAKAAVAVCLLILPSGAIGNPFEPVSGSWRGAVQFESTASSEGHSVGLLAAHIGADGQIDAVHPNGCKLSGVIALQSHNVYKLDARTQACSHGLLNRRWHGFVVYKQDQRALSISASSSDIGPDRKIRQFDFGGTLQR